MGGGRVRGDVTAGPGRRRRLDLGQGRARRDLRQTESGVVSLACAVGPAPRVTSTWQGRQGRGETSFEAEAVVSEDVRRRVLELVARGATFTAADVARALGLPSTSSAVARALRGLAEEGALRALGYRRMLRQERTALGVLTCVAYAPRRAPRARIAAVSSSLPTRTPVARPLGARGPAARKVRAQLDALGTKVEEGGLALIRAGEHLLALERLVGPRAAVRHAAETLGISGATYRRWRNIARAFGGQVAVASLALTRPSVLAALSAPSCPPELREELLRTGALAVGGRKIPAVQLRGRDVADAVRLRGGRR